MAALAALPFLTTSCNKAKKAGKEVKKAVTEDVSTATESTPEASDTPAELPTEAEITADAEPAEINELLNEEALVTEPASAEALADTEPVDVETLARDTEETTEPAAEETQEEEQIAMPSGEELAAQRTKEESSETTEAETVETSKTTEAEDNTEAAEVTPAPIEDLTKTDESKMSGISTPEVPEAPNMDDQIAAYYSAVNDSVVKLTDKIAQVDSVEKANDLSIEIAELSKTLNATTLAGVEFGEDKLAAYLKGNPELQQQLQQSAAKYEDTSKKLGTDNPAAANIVFGAMSN